VGFYFIIVGLAKGHGLNCYL